MLEPGIGADYDQDQHRGFCMRRYGYAPEECCKSDGIFGGVRNEAWLAMISRDYGADTLPEAQKWLTESSSMSVGMGESQ